MNDIIFTLKIIAPVFLLIVTGMILKKIRLAKEGFVDITSNIVFNVAFPALIFVNVAMTDFSKVANAGEILFCCFGIFVTFIISYILAVIFIKEDDKKGVFMQGAFRGNYATIGLAILSNIYGAAGLAKGAVILSFSLPVFNVLAIIGLVLPMHRLNRKGIEKILIRVVTNPNIIAVIAALFFSYFKIRIDQNTAGSILMHTMDSLANIALPLALLGIGASLDFKDIKDCWLIVSSSVAMKIILFPAVFTAIAYFAGFRDQSLVAMFLLFGVPTAVTSYVFAREMDGDSEIAAKIVVLTTLGSVLTLSVGILFFKMGGFIN